MSAQMAKMGWRGPTQFRHRSPFDSAQCVLTLSLLKHPVGPAPLAKMKFSDKFAKMG